VGETVRRILLMVAVLLPAGCSSLDSIPLSDVPIPEAAPRMAAEAPLPMPPPVRPQPDESSAVPSEPVDAAASVAAAPLFEEPVPPPATDSSSIPTPPPAGAAAKNTGEAIVSAVDTLLSPMPVMAFAEEASGGALTGDGALYRSGLVERRDVVGGEETLVPEARPETAAPAAKLDLTPASIDEVVLSRIEIPSLNAQTWIWVTIGFAALLGLFISARQASD
jgi:hypothetical protein